MGESMDLLSSGRLVFEGIQCFALQSEETEYFMYQSCEEHRDCGYFKGLAELTRVEREHFDKHLDTYLYYNRLVSDTSGLDKAKEENEWLVKHLMVV